MNDKKYELTNIRHPVYPQARRIRLLLPRFRSGGTNADEYGGYIESESCLSHETSCWVADNAVVLGTSVVRDFALVTGSAVIQDSTISGHARIRNRAIVRSSIVTDLSLVEDDAQVIGARVFRQSVVRGFSTLQPRPNSYHGPTLIDARVQCKARETSTEVTGEITLHDSTLFDDCKITNLSGMTFMTFTGSLNISGARINHMRDYAAICSFGSEHRTLMAFMHRDGIRYTTGCFLGTYDEIIESITDKYYGPQCPMYQAYMQAVDLLRFRLENRETLR